MLSNKLISVIVPVYNTERFLYACIESICRQTYRNLQIILVDDGSPDRCGVICDEYAVKDSRIKVIHQPNGGVVRAREAGITIAEGEYIAFVDSDDWIEPDMYRKMLEKSEAGNYDIVYCDIVKEYNSKSESDKLDFSDDPYLMISNLFQKRCMLYDKFISKTFYDSCSIQVDRKSTKAEDAYVYMQLLLSNPRLGYVPTAFYHFNCENENSLTHSLENDLKGIPNLIHIYELLKVQNLFDRYSREFSGWAISDKIRLLRLSKYREAKSLLPEIHRCFKTFEMMSFPVNLVYYLAFNGGFAGFYFFRLYDKIRNIRNK